MRILQSNCRFYAAESMKPLLLCVLLTACATPARHAPIASTAAVRQSLASAQGNVTSAQQSASKAASNVTSARGHAENIGSRLDTIHYDGKQILRILGHP